MAATPISVSPRARIAAPRVANRSPWVTAWLVLALASACRSTTNTEKYEQASTASDLSALVVEDLQNGRARECYEALRAFTITNVNGEDATYAHAVFTEARPVLMFQRYDGHKYIGAVSELGRLLKSASEKQMKRLYSAYAVGDIQTIRRALDGERTPLSTSVVAKDPELLPHRQFFEGAVALDALQSNPMRHASDAWPVVELMDHAGWSFSKKAMEEEYFFSLVVSAEALDFAGLPERAMEKWKLALASTYWPSVGADFGTLVKERMERSRNRARQDAATEPAKQAEPESTGSAAGTDAPKTEEPRRP